MSGCRVWGCTWQSACQSGCCAASRCRSPHVIWTPHYISALVSTVQQLRVLQGPACAVGWYGWKWTNDMADTMREALPDLQFRGHAVKIDTLTDDQLGAAIRMGPHMGGMIVGGFDLRSNAHAAAQAPWRGVSYSLTAPQPMRSLLRLPRPVVPQIANNEGTWIVDVTEVSKTQHHAYPLMQYSCRRHATRYVHHMLSIFWPCLLIHWACNAQASKCSSVFMLVFHTAAYTRYCVPLCASQEEATQLRHWLTHTRWSQRKVGAQAAFVIPFTPYSTLETQLSVLQAMRMRPNLTEPRIEVKLDRWFMCPDTVKALQHLPAWVTSLDVSTCVWPRDEALFVLFKQCVPRSCQTWSFAPHAPHYRFLAQALRISF